MKNGKTVAVIQARMGSTRLPGKVLRELAGRSVLAHVVNRAVRAPHLDAVVIATSRLPGDEPIAAEAARLGVPCHRGSEDDVLERYYEAAKAAGADVVVRITSDCPLLDPEVVGALIKEFEAQAGAVDYLSNTLERTYPRGLDAEVFSFGALEAAHREARSPHEREHVTPFLYQRPERFTLQQYLRQGASLAHLRWTLDTPEDWELITALYRALDGAQGLFSTEAVLAYLEAHPHLSDLNAHVEQKKLEGQEARS